MNDIINWENLFLKSQNFQNKTPFRYEYIQEVINENFYKKLLEEYPKLDEFENGSDFSKVQLFIDCKINGESLESKTIDKNLQFSENWKIFKNYVKSEAFLKNMRKFTGIQVNKLTMFKFIAYRNGGFQLPHAHGVGEKTLIVFFYFSPNWKDGEAGGTYFARDFDESEIIFEPYDLNNSMVLFQDVPNAIHGTRMITNGRERKAIQLVLEITD